MDLERASVVLRPRGTLELTDLTFRFVRDVNLSSYLWLTFSLLTPAAAALLLLRHGGSFGALGLWATCILGGTVLQAPFTVLAGKLMFADQTTAREAWSAFLKRLPAFLGALFLSRGLVLLSAGVLTTRGLFTDEACLLERASPPAAWKRASALSKADPGEAMSTLVAMTSLTCGCVVAAELLGHATAEYLLVLGNLGGSLTNDGISAFAIIGYFASLPLSATFRFLSYINFRTRRDGWDIQVRFMALAAR